MQQTNFKFKHITLAVLASLLTLPVASTAEEVVQDPATTPPASLETQQRKL